MEKDLDPGPAIYVVATPIGNLQDLTPRAQRILTDVDLICAEDTRTASKLLSQFGISGKQLVSYHNYSERAKAPKLVERLLNTGERMAIISDAGTPCVADPGYHLISQARSQGIRIIPIPGPSALLSLISVAGLPTDRFGFVGFLPAKPSAREKEFLSWQQSGIRTWIFFEATRRLHRTLGQLYGVYPTARVVIGREMTKLHEEVCDMPLSDAVEWAGQHESLRGEASVAVYLDEAAMQEGSGLSEEAILQESMKRFRAGASLKELLQEFAECGHSRRELYQLLLQAKDSI